MQPALGLFSKCCPYCKSIDFTNVGPGNGIEKFLARLLHPYRCGLCGRHFCLVRQLVEAS